MRGKKAKLLRRQARRRAEGRPLVGYEMNANTKVIRVKLDTVRGLYLNFKKWKVAG